MKINNEYPQEFYELLRKKRITKKNVFEKIASWNETEILDFSKEAHLKLLAAPKPSRAFFTFSANSSLSGAPFPCVSPSCRLNNLDSVARFSILYSDKVYVTNPFERYVYKDTVDNFTEMLLAGDILSMFHIQPLIKTGIIGIQNNIYHLCSKHKAEIETLEKAIYKQVERAEKALRRMYHKEANIRIVAWDDEIFLTVSGPEYLVEHGRRDLIGKLPDAILQNYTLGEERELTKREIRDNKLFDYFVNPIARDLFQQSVRVRLYQTQYLTNRRVEQNLVASIDKPEVAQASKALLGGLSHSVPTIDTVSLTKLLDLRKKEGEAFNVYRDKLHSALGQAGNLNQREMRQLVADEISPEIHKIERTINNNRRLLRRSLKDDLLIGVGYVAIGLFSGLLSQQAAEIITALGGFSFVSSIAKKASQYRSEPREILDNPYYFLWKTKKIK